ncbi:MAG TPA: lysophospholipid acyltransferase family protein [Burkholderiales bacterium]
MGKGARISNLHRLPTIALELIAGLPLRVLHALGGVLGWAMYGSSPTYRRHLRENLAQAGLAQAPLRRAAIAAAGRMLAELPAIWFRPRAAVLSLVKKVHGLEAALAARDAGKALLFLTPHMGCFEIAAQYATVYTPITVLYRRPKLAWIEPLMRAGRARDGVRLAPADLSGVRELYAALRRREAVGFLPDQVPGVGEGQWAEFFGRPAYTATLAGRLAARPDVACFLAFARRLPRGAGYEIVLRPLPEPLPDEAPTRRINRALEALVRECPEQYLWGYNRYKKPNGKG